MGGILAASLSKGALEQPVEQKKQPQSQFLADAPFCSWEFRQDTGSHF
jgi:hypothetical protein